MGGEGRTKNMLMQVKYEIVGGHGCLLLTCGVSAINSAATMRAIATRTAWKRCLHTVVSFAQSVVVVVVVVVSLCVSHGHVSLRRCHTESPLGHVPTPDNSR